MVYDVRDAFFEGVQARQHDDGLWETIPLVECVREDALLDVFLPFNWRFVRSASHLTCI